MDEPQDLQGSNPNAAEDDEDVTDDETDPDAVDDSGIETGDEREAADALD
jgi:hypothetical protein